MNKTGIKEKLKHGSPSQCSILLGQSKRMIRDMRDCLIAIKQNDKKTSLELSHLSGIGRYTLARRLPDLSYSGLVRVKSSRPCTKSRLTRPCFVWSLTNKGIDTVRGFESE